MKRLTIFFGILGISTTPVSLIYNSENIKNKQLDTNYDFSNLETRSKIDLNTITTKDLKMDVGPLKGLTEDVIKKSVLLEIVQQNDKNKTINDVIMGAIYQPQFWDISGIQFIVPEKYKSVKYSLKITAVNYNPDFLNTLFINVELCNQTVYDVVYNPNIWADTLNVDKSWGTGKASMETREVQQEIDLSSFGGINLLKENYESIDVTLKGNYFFKKGKNFAWSEYDYGKNGFTIVKNYNFSNKNDFEPWQRIIFKTSDSGYEWGNYYKVWINLEMLQNKIKISSTYQIAAYGVGASKHWTAGDLCLSEIKFKAKTS
ncbi:hypothetical protein [Spiroplasma floricola]|uniref:Uncharacterized protein n=1 Tax=Spiroplasma floricola 23-6 TaxID=1336749 RepID=A0A2K8SCQ4_9MOLU|nr:hypothetical protein [Spiroplasma floricola]AUB31251.1 hypothetical protein SFLOR_v1c01900 [Spiroplasma floricola 23-6]